MSHMFVNVVDMDSCIPLFRGCMSCIATNYNSSANTDDNSCYNPGVMSDWADNYVVQLLMIISLGCIYR